MSVDGSTISHVGRGVSHWEVINCDPIGNVSIQRQRWRRHDPGKEYLILRVHKEGIINPPHPPAVTVREHLDAIFGPGYVRRRVDIGIDVNATYADSQIAVSLQANIGPNSVASDWSEGRVVAWSFIQWFCNRRRQQDYT